MNKFGKESAQKTFVENNAQASPKNEGVIIIRPSFMKFCEDGCRAALFNHILYWIAWKAKDQLPELVQSGKITYYATTEQLTEQMAGAWGSQKVRREVNALIEMGLFGREKNPTWGADRTKHFSFGKEQCQRLLELCQKHEINLFQIGLPTEVIDLIKTVRQITNPSNANYQSVNCPEHKQITNPSNANYQSVRAITKVTTKITNTEIAERKNGTPQQKPTVSLEQETTHSSIHASHSQKNFSFSSQEKQEEVALTEEEQAIYDFGCQTIFKAKPPRKTAKLKGECAELAKYITTLEQFQKLVQSVRALPYIQGQVHLKNLVNELNGWLQSLEARPVGSSRGKPRGPFIAQQPTASEQEENERKNVEAIAKLHAMQEARRKARQQQEGAKA